MNLMNLAPPESVAGEHFDVIIVGSGFGSSFFLHRLLRQPGRRVLVLEWGRHSTHDWQLEEGRNSPVTDSDTYATNSEKPWNFTIGFGGGTNCWFAQTPRLHPADFRLGSDHGVAQDWPVSYDDLEPYWCEAEEIMAVSGDPDMAQVMPRSRPFPQPPHVMPDPDRLMKAARPDSHFVMPTARARIATETRAACCASLRCQICPADAKFTANNSLVPLYETPGVTLCLETEVRRFEAAGSSISAAVIRGPDGREHKVTGDLFVLGANAIHSPAILLRSDLGGGLTGVGLHESYGWSMEAWLDGVDNFGGSTITTGLDFGLYDGPHRKDRGAALVYFENRWSHGMRLGAERMRQTLPLVIVTEDLPEDRNRVTLDGEGRAFIDYHGPSDYALRGMERAKAALPELLAPLPVEKILDHGIRETESHLQGTLRMGSDPASSVVDAGLVHHRLRNLVVVGTSTFPTCSAANPSLTAAALSLRAADLLI
ncbi:GMC family oxidoreductase [Cereibacter sphaeroides]|nr:GMC family oxidoreductase [Cereibacter sphaeroides]AZB61896.1 GMC family oxidoreductase [Cereibacter sphaeroides]